MNGPTQNPPRVAAGLAAWNDLAWTAGDFPENARISVKAAGLDQVVSILQERLAGQGFEMLLADRAGAQSGAETPRAAVVVWEKAPHVPPLKRVLNWVRSSESRGPLAFVAIAVALAVASTVLEWPIPFWMPPLVVLAFIGGGWISYYGRRQATVVLRATLRAAEGVGPLTTSDQVTSYPIDFAFAQVLSFNSGAPGLRFRRFFVGVSAPRADTPRLADLLRAIQAPEPK